MCFIVLVALIHVKKNHALQTELDFINGRTQMRGRIAYDEANERFRILDQVEFRNPNSDYFFGHYFFFKEVKFQAA